MGLKEEQEHYGPETVPIVRTTKENNKVFRENQKKDLPFFAIRKGPKMFYIEYDFIATTHILKEEVTKEIEEITVEMGQNSKYYGSGNSFYVYSMGQCVGISEKFPLNECKQYAPKIRDIIFNPNNWELSDAGRLKQALESDDPMAMIHYELETGKIRRLKREKIEEKRKLLREPKFDSLGENKMLNNPIYELIDKNSEMMVQEAEETLYHSLKMLDEVNKEIGDNTTFVIQNLTEIATSINTFSKSVPLMEVL